VSNVDYEIDQDGHYDVVVLVTAGAADVTISLPELGLSTFNTNRWIRIKKVGGAFRVIVATTGGDLIDSTYTSVALKKKGEVLDLFSSQFGGDPFWEIV